MVVANRCEPAHYVFRVFYASVQLLSMNGFDLDPFGDITEDIADQDLTKALGALRSQYFPDLKTEVVIRIVPDEKNPAKVLITQNAVIELSSSAAKWPKMARVLILHELVHLRKQGLSDENELAPPFQGELQRLWEKGAYKNLL